MAYDQNGNRLRRDVRKEGDGWGVTVWFGGAYRGSIATNVARYIYRTREQARDGDIAHSVGRHGRIG